MPFDEVIARQRMVRPPYADRAVDPHLVDEVLAAARRAPSAGFTQGVDFVVLEGRATSTFWRHTRPRTPDDHPDVPVVVLPLEHRQAYLDRYSEPDKERFGLGADPDAWPVPYWTVDAAFASMLVLLSATAHGLGAWFFGIFAGERALLDELGVPPDRRAIGAIAMGWPHAHEQRRGSTLRRRHRPVQERIHRGHW